MRQLCNPQFRNNIWPSFLLCATVMVLWSCESTRAVGRAAPAVAATTAPTIALPCSGGIWGAIAEFAGPQIPLPPLTVSGPTTYNPSGAWTGYYVALCTASDQQQVETYMTQHMLAEGWTLGAPPADCLCDGLPVWRRANDGRLVQFDHHPAYVSGDLRWGITIFTRAAAQP